jgi:hypothetical protein
LPDNAIRRASMLNSGEDCFHRPLPFPLLIGLWPQTSLS